VHFRIEGSDVRTGALSVRIIEAADEIEACQRAAVFPFFRFARAVPMRRVPVWERPPGAAAPIEPVAPVQPLAAEGICPTISPTDGAGTEDDDGTDYDLTQPPEMEVPTVPWTQRGAAAAVVAADDPDRVPLPIPPAVAAARPRYPWRHGPVAPPAELPEGSVPLGVRVLVILLIVINAMAIASLVARRAAPAAAIGSVLGVCAFGLLANALTLAATAIAAWSHSRHRALATERLLAYAAAAALLGVFAVSFATGMGWLGRMAPMAETPVAST